MVGRPIVSVLMCVYNRQDLVGEAIESILGQTFKDYEFIVVDDGFTDQTCDILQEYAKKDDRIQLIFNGQNCGISSDISEGLQECKEKYIARMNSDGISKHEKLAKQVEFIEAHSEIDLCGTCCELIDEISELLINGLFAQPIHCLHGFICSLDNRSSLLH